MSPLDLLVLAHAGVLDRDGSLLAVCRSLQPKQGQTQALASFLVRVSLAPQPQLQPQAQLGQGQPAQSQPGGGMRFMIEVWPAGMSLRAEPR